MNEQNILLVEDNENLNDGNRRLLEAEGYGVLTALTLAEARERLSRFSPAVILLDVMLPDGDGIDFCTEIRDRTDAHIIFLTSRREHEEKLRGLAVGGDDYITKPFKTDELLHRVAAAMRRRGMSKLSSQTVAKGNLLLKITPMSAFIDGVNMSLTQKEFSLLLLFVNNEGRTLGTEYLYEQVWVQPSNENNQAVKSTVTRLRKKLAGSGYAISSVYGEGYCFEAE